MGYSITQAEFRYEKKDYEKSLQFLKESADDELNLFALSGTNVATKPLPRNYDRLFSLLLEKLNKQIPTKKDKNNLAEELAFQFLEQRRYRSFRNFIVQSTSKKISSTQASEAEKRALAEINKIKGLLKNGDSPKLQKSLQTAYSDYENIVVQEQFSDEIRRAISTVKPSDLKTIQEKLSGDTALIEYIFAGEKVFALVVTKEHLRSFPLPISRSNLKNKTRLLRSAIFQKENESADWRPIAESLRKSLIEPIEKTDVLKNTERLAFIPFGFLHDMPFAVLVKRGKRSKPILN